jgi:glycosyltransferase involved in cell wall biosynthesis
MIRPLDLLFVGPHPASPPTFGAQRRAEGLMRALGKRHRVSFVGLAAPHFDREAARRAIAEYCADVVLVPCPAAEGTAKRLEQLRSLGSLHSFERRYMNAPALRRALASALRSRRFDLVSLEAAMFAFADPWQAPPGAPPPAVLIDAHNVEYDLARQQGARSAGPVRWLHHAANTRKLERDEVRAWRSADGVAFTSPDDLARARAAVPSLRAAVIPNGVDTAQFSPRPDLPRPDGRTVVFFGTMNYFPNADGIRWLLDDIWPGLARRHPRARLKLIGSHPLPDVVARQGPRVEVAGLVEDLPRHLAEAAVVVVPLRVGGGTRLKILEALSMGKPVVSTTIGAEGIAARAGEHLLIADEPGAFADAVGRVLDDPALAERLGAAGRGLAERAYSWDAVGASLERFLGELLGRPSAPGPAVAALG